MCTVQKLYRTIPYQIMSAQKTIARGNVSENAFNQRAADFAFSGALHEQHLKDQRREGLDGMHSELNRLESNLIRGQALPSIAVKPSTGSVKDDTIQPKDGQFSGSAQIIQRHRPTPTWKKPAMRRWHAETAYDQAWSAVHHMTDAACGSHKTGGTSDGAAGRNH